MTGDRNKKWDKQKKKDTGEIETKEELESMSASDSKTSPPTKSPKLSSRKSPRPNLKKSPRLNSKKSESLPDLSCYIPGSTPASSVRNDPATLVEPNTSGTPRTAPTVSSEEEEEDVLVFYSMGVDMV